MAEMLSEDSRKAMEKQSYRFAGSHSAVKICGWTKKSMIGEGTCYKHKFYGIRSGQCMQMTTSISCANRCIFCWRDYKAPISQKWDYPMNTPEEILEGSLEGQKKLLTGMKGNTRVNLKAYELSKTVKHVAISLTGEGLMYPKINEFVNLLHKKGMSTFLVTNGQYPAELKDLRPITQLYLSIDAPNEKLMAKIDKPLFENSWERFNKSLDAVAAKKHRACIRVTLIKGVNMVEPENFAALIKKADADFIEVKAYMFIGGSRQRLSMKNMPYHEDVVEFSKLIAAHLPEHEMMSEHIASRVVLFAKKKYKKEDGWHTWIDFDKWEKLSTSNAGNGAETDFDSMDYSCKTPDTGISGKKTSDYTEAWKKKKEIQRTRFENSEHVS